MGVHVQPFPRMAVSMCSCSVTLAKPGQITDHRPSPELSIRFHLLWNVMPHIANNLHTGVGPAQECGCPMPGATPRADGAASSASSWLLHSPSRPNRRARLTRVGPWQSWHSGLSTLRSPALLIWKGREGSLQTKLTCDKHAGFRCGVALPWTPRSSMPPRWELAFRGFDAHKEMPIVHRNQGLLQQLRMSWGR